MRRGNEPYRSYAAIEDVFNLPDDIRQFQLMCRIILRVAADLIVLAIKALHVAMGEKDVANSISTGDYRLLTSVGENRANTESGATPAVTQIIGVAFSVAVAGTTGAV